MSLTLTHYDILGVDPNADTVDIRKAYHKQLRATHPDTAQSDAARHLFALVQQAYEVLGDAAKRENYDRDLQKAATPASNPPTGPTPPEEPVTPSWGQESAWEEPITHNTSSTPVPPSYEYAVPDVSPTKEEAVTAAMPGKKWMVTGLVATILGHLAFALTLGNLIIFIVCYFFFYVMAARRSAHTGKKGWFIFLSILPALGLLLGLQVIFGNAFQQGLALIALSLAVGGGMVLFRNNFAARIAFRQHRFS